MRFSKQVLASLLCALSSNIYFLIGLRVRQSTGAVVVAVLSMSIVAEIFPDEEMGGACWLLAQAPIRLDTLLALPWAVI